MDKPQTPVHRTNQPRRRTTTGSHWIFLLVLLGLICQSVSSSPTIANSHCVSYSANYRYVTKLIQYQAAPSPPQALPVAIYQVAPSATYQILDQDFYPLLCFNISCLPHGDYFNQRCLWEVAVADPQCIEYTSEGSILLSKDGEDSFMIGPDPANYPIISHVNGDVFISLNGRDTVKLATIGEAEYVRLLNVSDNSSYVKFPTIDYINSEHNCLVMNPCRLHSFEHVPWLFTMKQSHILYLKAFPKEKVSLSVYNICNKTWSHGSGEELEHLAIPSNSWQQVNIRTSKYSTQIRVTDKIHLHYEFQSSERAVCDETVYIIAVAGASFSLSCDATFGDSSWLWFSIGAAALVLLLTLTVIAIFIVKRIKGIANHPLGPFVRQISDISLLRSFNGHGTEP